MKIIGILRSLNDEAGAGTRYLRASSIQSATIVFNGASAPLLHVSDRLFSLARVFNAIDSLDNALTLIVSTYGQVIRPELKVTMFELVVSAATSRDTCSRLQSYMEWINGDKERDQQRMMLAPHLDIDSSAQCRILSFDVCMYVDHLSFCKAGTTAAWSQSWCWRQANPWSPLCTCTSAVEYHRHVACDMIANPGQVVRLPAMRSCFA
jgi:hypothetical protein